MATALAFWTAVLLAGMAVPVRAQGVDSAGDASANSALRDGNTLADDDGESGLWPGFIDPLTPAALRSLREAESPDIPVISDGRAKLSWESYEGAEGYRVRELGGAVFYEGRIPRAFISGLPDGDHEFVVEALDADGGVLAASPQSTVMVVQHWKLSTAFSLLSVGAVVFACIVGVLWAGCNRREGKAVAS